MGPISAGTPRVSRTYDGLNHSSAKMLFCRCDLIAESVRSTISVISLSTDNCHETAFDFLGQFISSSDFHKLVLLKTYTYI